MFQKEVTLTHDSAQNLNLIQPRSKETNECEWVEFLAYQCQCLWGGHHSSLTLPFVTCRVWSQFDIFLSISVFSWGGRIKCEKQYFFLLNFEWWWKSSIWWIAPEEMLLYGCLLKVHDRTDLRRASDSEFWWWDVAHILTLAAGGQKLKPDGIGIGASAMIW